jgi:flagellar hook-associated protein 2
MISGSTDIQSLAAQFIRADRASQDQYFSQRKAGFENTLKLYSALTSKIGEFRDTLKTLSESPQFEAYSVTQSAEGYATITATSSAAAGQYEMHIGQMASAHQVALDFASETDPMPTSGNLTLGVGADSFTIDMSTLDAGADLTTLRDAINSDPANPGIKASIVRTDGAVKLLIASEDTGAANVLSMSTDGDPAMADIQTAIDTKTELSQALDAEIFLGADQSLKLTSSTNVFDNAIDGLKIDLHKAHATVGETLTFTVSQDSEATKEQLQKLVDGYNAIRATVEAHPDAKDNTSRMLLRQLRLELSNAGVSTAGLEFSRDGDLTINSAKMEKFLANDPDGLTTMLSGAGGLMETLTTRLDSFTKGEDALLKSSTKAVRSSLDQLQNRMERFDYRMEQVYNRYVQQFSQMQELIGRMEQTFNLF